MNATEEYILSEYQEMGSINEHKEIRLLRNKITGNICVKKLVSPELKSIYEFLKSHPHPNLPIIYEIILDQEKLLIIEEYLTGQNLQEILNTHLFTEEEAKSIVLRLCRALEPLHKAMIICRDLKPENVMLTTSGEVKLIDFDIARTYQEGQSRDTKLMGTEAFAAPEQYGFQQTDARTDIYSLGVMINYLILKQFPIDQVVSGSLQKVVKRCISLDPKDRYQSVGELARDLNENISTGESKSFLPPGFRSRTPWKMCVAVVGYMILTMLCYSLTFDSNGVLVPAPLQMIYRIIIWFSQMTFIAIVYDYRNCRQRLPLVNHHNRFLRMVGYILYETILFFTGIFLCAVLELIFSSV